MLKPSELFSRLNTIDSELSALKEEREWIRSKLGGAVPENMAADGVYHQASPKVSVSYAKAFDHVVKTYVPRTRQHLAEIALEQFKARTVGHHYRLAKLSDQHVEEYAEEVAV